MGILDFGLPGEGGIIVAPAGITTEPGTRGARYVNREFVYLSRGNRGANFPFRGFQIPPAVSGVYARRGNLSRMLFQEISEINRLRLTAAATARRSLARAAVDHAQFSKLPSGDPGDRELVGQQLM